MCIEMIEEIVKWNEEEFCNYIEYVFEDNVMKIITGYALYLPPEIKEQFPDIELREDHFCKIYGWYPQSLKNYPKNITGDYGEFVLHCTDFDDVDTTFFPQAKNYGFNVIKFLKIENVCNVLEKHQCKIYFLDLCDTTIEPLHLYHCLKIDFLYDPTNNGYKVSYWSCPYQFKDIVQKYILQEPDPLMRDIQGCKFEISLFNEGLKNA